MSQRGRRQFLHVSLGGAATFAIACADSSDPADDDGDGDGGDGDGDGGDGDGGDGDGGDGDTGDGGDGDGDPYHFGQIRNTLGRIRNTFGRIQNSPMHIPIFYFDRVVGNRKSISRDRNIEIL